MFVGLACAKELCLSHISHGRAHLARFIAERVGALVDELNSSGYSFGPCDYSGDINFENSEQTFCNGAEMGEGIILHFHGYSV